MRAADHLTLRPATPDDAGLLAAWDEEPHVIACVTDDPEATSASKGDDLSAELADQSDIFRYLIAEVDGRPIGAMLDIDPAREPYGYWAPIGDGFRALDIWIGEADALGRGYGTRIMTRALDACFARPEVQAVLIDPLASNVDAHRFYRRLGFRPAERRLFNDENDCLVHRLDRADWAASRASVA